MTPNCKFLTVMVGGLVMLIAAMAPAGEMMSAASAPAPSCCKANQPTESAAASRLRMTLDPMQFSGSVREAYKVAQENPELLAQLHCYCGCDRVNGHKNLLDCYRDHHGASCSICSGEALEAKKLFDQGASVEMIREALRTRFAGTAN